MVACCVSFISIAQDSTRMLKEVEIMGIDLSQFSSGTVVNSLREAENGSLASIGNRTSIYFKNYGSQQLSTISLRGTSASHTSVIWNGIPVNSPTLGQTDFSVWPMYLTDRLLLQKGGGSSLFGSGAIGGTIIVDNSRIQKDSLVNLYLGYGSFGQKEAGFQLQVEKGRVTNELTLFGSQIENDFKLEDGSRQDHASVKRLGFSNKIAYQHKRGRLFSEIAYAENDRDIQPTRTSASRSTLQSKNVRTVLNSELTGKVTHHSTLGVISDQTIFNDTSITTSYRIAATHAIEKSIKSMVFIRVGGTGIHEWAESGNFEGIERLTQGHLFASGTISNPIASITLNLRQAFYRTNEVFIPSLGIESPVTRLGNAFVRFRWQLSRDYRVPTFNDLFWRPGGNINLQAERSMNYEIGTDITFSNLSFNFTGFTSNISNWIQWTPTDGVWSPENIRAVQTKGLEVSSNSSFKIKSLTLSIDGEYSYILSTDKGLAEDNQLPYVPKHSAMVSAALISKNSTVEWIGNYTGQRFTTLSNSRTNRIDDFFLMDLRVAQKISFVSTRINAAFSIRNIMDVNYENLKNTAMPGRTLLIELTTKI